MKNILTYYKLYIDYFKINLKSVMVYDYDFLIGVISLIIKNIMNFIIIIFIFNLLDNIDGWTFDQILFLYGFNTVSYSLWHCFFVNTISLSYYIKTGIFDRFLLRPVQPIFQIMTDNFDEDGWGQLIFGLVLLVIAIFRLRLFSIYLLLLPILLVSASLIYASISLLGSITIFYTLENTDFSDLVMELQDFGKYPLSIYSGFLRIILTVVIPLGFAAYYPSLFYITNYQASIGVALITPIVSIIFFYVTCCIWNKSLKAYTSTGS
ncbi:ABC transporter permease [Anaerobranca gottschalkii]|uniref:ABC-2 type transport system permease protein n=1 Tax=Anaerobranca gottschalkii DSM 13577 TaxID=1120990 RepID=A0A1H9YEI3_9FIRM|nr:ABC-2 family transporter protein [Anaerobranca gottschalkii]SES67324.1 ABC-2 type transport system permease protein [Anaerobranca gottschalkii DSM 13577]